jgi:ubiquinone/menaquinone biosynthesis C-methylase UbiE
MSDTVAKAVDPYSWAADRAEEERRLIAQSRLFEPMTEELLRQAGLAAGMHVVDLGSGAGDCAILAARLVGPAGSVLGIERSAEQVALARHRIAALGLDNVTIRQGDVAALADVLAEHPTRIDAVIGRLILLWVPQRHAVLAACARGLAPGSLVWFLEPDVSQDFAVPTTPLWEQVQHWVRRAVVDVGAELRMGPKLDEAFRAAGLPAPERQSRTITVGPSTAPVWFCVNAVRAMVPILEQNGVATAAEVDIDTLEARLAAELVAYDATMVVPPVTIAWTRVPG